jgi:N-acetyl-alpha-D-muramate 1-phosphate uridylyltransferase
VTGLCALVLAAGEGHRLRPLTLRLPKALCPVGNIALIDRALARLARHGLSGPSAVAVNACYLADQVAAHVGGRAFVSREPGPPALGTAGAVAALRDWIAGRGLLVGNADAYLSSRVPDTRDLAPLLDGWDGLTVRLLVITAEDGRAVEFRAEGRPPMRFAGFTLIPADLVAALPAGRSELVHEVWRPAERAGRLELVAYDGVYIDTGTPSDYLAANLHAAGAGSLIATDAVVSGPVTHSVVGAGARVRGSIERAVVLPGGEVASDEKLVDAIRQGADITVAG